MNKTQLEEMYITLAMSQRDIAKAENISQTTVRYYLLKYSIKRNTSNSDKPDPSRSKKCPSCNVVKPGSDFYWQSGKRARQGSWCKSCMNSQVVRRQQDYKKQAVELKGGKCSVCGYSKYLGALEFHHLDPYKKDLNIAMITQSSKKFKQLTEELDKCVLLCANCHREEHARQKGLI